MGSPLPTWGDVTLLGAASPVYVRASAHNDFRCNRHQWLRAHPNVSVARGERRLAGAPFILGEVKEIVESGLVQPGIGDAQTRTEWIRARTKRLHERHRLYVKQAADAVIDLYLDLDEQDGPFTYQGRHAEWTHLSTTRENWAVIDG